MVQTTHLLLVLHCEWLELYDHLPYLPLHLARAVYVYIIDKLLQNITVYKYIFGYETAECTEHMKCAINTDRALLCKSYNGFSSSWCAVQTHPRCHLYRYTILRKHIVASINTQKTHVSYICTKKEFSEVNPRSSGHLTTTV